MTDTATPSAHEAIKADVEANDVVLFMKGTASMPQCGFSSRVAGVLNYLGVQYKDVNVLADDPAALRQGRVHRRLRHRHRDGAVGRARRALRGEGHRL